MSYSVKFRRGTTIEHATFTGGEGEVTVDTTTNSLVVHDGVTVGGHAVASGGDAGGSVAIYASITARDAVSSNEGDLAFLSDSDTLHVYNGSAWIRVWAGPDELPAWTTELPGLVTLNSDGTPTTITVAATDSDGFDIVYTYDTSPSNQSQATIANNNDGTFTLTPSTSGSDTGDFTFRAKATDGLHVISTTSITSLSFFSDITFDSSESGIASNTTNYVSWQETSHLNGASTSNELATGRKYFEVHNSHQSTHWLMGLVRSATPQPQGDYAEDNAVYYGENGIGIVYANGVYTNTNLGKPVSGSIIQIAYDTTTDEVWFGRNNAWWPSHPASGAGFPIGGTPGTTFRLGFASSSGATVYYVGNIITGSQTFTYPVPTGFTGH